MSNVVKISDDFKTSNNCNGEVITNNKVDRLSANENMNDEEIINEVSSNYSNEFNSEIKSDNSDVVEKEVSMCDTLSNISDDESGRLVGINNEVLVSVDELEKEWEESLQVEGLQRVNVFLWCCCGRRKGFTSVFERHMVYK